MSGYLTLDSGVLVGAERGDRAIWAALLEFVDLDWVPVVPTAVLAEVWRGGRQSRLSRAIRHCRIDVLDEATARRAGELCARAGLDDRVDAVVVITASRFGGQLWSADPDIASLVQHLPTGARPVVVRSGRA